MPTMPEIISVVGNIQINCKEAEFYPSYVNSNEKVTVRIDYELPGANPDIAESRKYGPNPSWNKLYQAEVVDPA